MNNGPLKTIAVIGRPNVGKSTLFNRLAGRREAIETPIPGTTRDRLYAQVSWRGRKFELVDVAGIETGTKDEIKKIAQEGVGLAIESADLVLFVVDWNDKDNEIDKTIARNLRKTDKEVLLVVNKADNRERQTEIEEFKRFGSFEIVPVSAISGQNTGDLLDKISSKLNLSKAAKNDADLPTSLPADMLGLAIIGRPNVGKSTLLNSIIGEKRAIVSSVPGTTRDAFNVDFWHKGKLIRIYDTAGIRRRGKITKDTIESFSVLRAHRAMRESDIVILVIDAKEGLVALDSHLLGEAFESGKGVVLAANKIDLWGDKTETKMAQMIASLQKTLNFAPWLPVVFISAQDGTHVKSLLNQVLAAENNRNTTIVQKDLDAILEFAKKANMQLANLTSLKQKKTKPPIFEITYRGKEKPHRTQIRYLENKIRDVFPLEGTPLFIDAE